MTPDKYQTRIINLIGQAQKDIAKAAIDHAPFGVQMVLRDQPRVRNSGQNNLYWHLLGEIAEQAWMKDGAGNDRQYSADVWHEYAKQKIMPETIKTKDGEQRSKWLEMPDGKVTVISTTHLDRKCFADYITALEAFGAGLGVLFSAQP